MNEKIEGKVFDENEQLYLIQADGITYQAEKSLIDQPLKVGEILTGYIYEDRNDTKRFHYPIPQIIEAGYVWGTITGVLPRLGVFVDVGLINKEIVISLDDLPEDTAEWPRDGDQLYLSLEIDHKDRYWGKMASREDLKEIEITAPPRLMNQDIEVIILENKGIGYNGISVEGFITFIHESEVTEPLRLGQKIQARVVDVHHDGRINVSMRPRAYEVIDDDAKMLMVMLERSPNGFLPLHDKSDPEVIRDRLGISKKQFKRALGSLLKDGLVRQVIQEGIYLVDQNDSQ